MTTPQKRPGKVYLAGPWVFLPERERAAHRNRVVRHLRGSGIKPLFPDDGLPGTKPSAVEIRAANLNLIRSASALIADLTPFRGKEPDSGTAYECAFAHALGIPVYGYARCAPYSARVGVKRDSAEGRLLDADGRAVEDFGLPVNLMLAAHIVGESLPEAIEKLLQES